MICNSGQYIAGRAQGVGLPLGMLWTQYRIAALITSGMTLFTTPPGGKEAPPVHPAPAVVAKRVHHLHSTASPPWTIYLSFDDGPSAGSRIVNRLSLIDTLAINVFLVGHNACFNAVNRELVEDYKSNPLVEVGNHSFTHANRKYEQFFRDPSVVLADVNRSRDSLQLGNGLVRLPGRNFFRVEGLRRDDRNNGAAAADTLAANGYQVFGWDLEWRRKAGKGIGTHSGAEMLAVVTRMIGERRTFMPGQIVMLLHDHDLLDGGFREQVEAFVRLAREDGRFEFDHLSEYY